MVFQFVHGRLFIVFSILSQQICFGEVKCPGIILYSDVIGRDQKGTLTFGDRECPVEINEIKNDHVTIYLAILAAVGFLLWILTLCITCCICCCKCKSSHYNEAKQNKRERIMHGPPTAPPEGEAPRPNMTGPARINNEPVYNEKTTQSWHGPGSFTLNTTSRMYDDPPESGPRDDEVASEVDTVRSLYLEDDLYDSYRNRLASYLEKGRSCSIAVDSFHLPQFKSSQNDLKPSHRTLSEQVSLNKRCSSFSRSRTPQTSFISPKENNDAKMSTVTHTPDNLYDIVDVSAS